MEATLWPYGKCKKCANKNYCAWSEREIKCWEERHQAHINFDMKFLNMVEEGME